MCRVVLLKGVGVRGDWIISLPFAARPSEPSNPSGAAEFKRLRFPDGGRDSGERLPEMSRLLPLSFGVSGMTSPRPSVRGVVCVRETEDVRALEREMDGVSIPGCREGPATGGVSTLKMIRRGGGTGEDTGVIRPNPSHGFSGLSTSLSGTSSCSCCCSSSCSSSI